MPDPSTVFYSWQSDTPSNLNRSFIEKALEKALNKLHSDATLQLAERPKLDQGTKDVPGSPPIADTILKKIDGCAAFVADLTFVGKSLDGLMNSSDKPRLIPNPNVLIEHGYALRCRGHSYLVGVMNTAFGEPSWESMPFDLRHLRWPITYHLENRSDDEKSAKQEQLTNELVVALRPILANRVSQNESLPEFVPRASTRDAATFWTDQRDLLVERTFHGRNETYNVPNDARGYLRLYPAKITPPLPTALDAVDLARIGDLRPLGPVIGDNRMSGYSADRNSCGAFVYEAPKDGDLFHFTQLFLSKEIWGVDASSFNRTEIGKFLERTLSPPQRPYVASGLLEENFAVALNSYLNFARKTLKLPTPLKFEAGLVGIKGYAIAIQRSIGGTAHNNHVSLNGEINSHEITAAEVLGPFFDLVWAEFGFRRDPVHQAALVQQFGKRISGV